LKIESVTYFKTISLRIRLLKQWSNIFETFEELTSSYIGS